jgi:hypothetical protein
MAPPADDDEARGWPPCVSQDHERAIAMLDKSVAWKLAAEDSYG